MLGPLMGIAKAWPVVVAGAQAGRRILHGARVVIDKVDDTVDDIFGAGKQKRNELKEGDED